MSRLETAILTVQDNLPPELQRRLQVEELWARRNVLAGVMNADRLKAYNGRRTDITSGCAATEVASTRDKLERPVATVLQIKDHKFISRA